MEKKYTIGMLNSLTAEIEDGGAPQINETTASLNALGEYITAFQPRMNAFIRSLVNRIVATTLAKKAYSNHFGSFKKKVSELGDTVEEIYIGLTKVAGYDPSTVAQKLFGINTPDVSTAFHAQNLALTYDVTVNEIQVAKAFTSFDEMAGLVAGIIANVIDSIEYDEEQMFKYTLAKLLISGKIPVVEIDEPSTATAAGLMTEVKRISDDMTFRKTKYNLAKVLQHTAKADQYLFEDCAVSAIVDVNVLATSFNMDKAEFMGHQVLVDGFGEINVDRIGQLLSEDPDYVAFSSGELETLAKARCLLVDKNFFQIYENYRRMHEIPVDGLQRNYKYNLGYTYSVSPFKNCVLFTDASNTVTNIAVNGSSALSSAGTYDYSATVTRTNFADPGVVWSVAAGTAASIDKISINQLGQLKVRSGYATGTITVKATSVFDGSVVGTKTVTLS